MSIKAIRLSIDGVTVKSPKVGGITRKEEKIWSKNTGRAASARMQGTIKAIKTTYSISWPPLTQAEKDLIESLVSNPNMPFHVLRLTQPDNTALELECYFGTPSFTEWTLLGGQWRCIDGKVDAIER